jgi:peptidoglycan L-alanyl-D-glutamate endopeptidase CwlK
MYGRDDMRKWSNRSLSNLTGVHQDLRRVMDRALQDSPVDFVITEGLRTLERQRELVRIKASTTLNSRHLTGHAVDLYAYVDVNLNGKVEFVEMVNPRLMRQIANAIKAAALEEKVPIVWGGDWRSFKDYPHFELDRRFYPAK